MSDNDYFREGRFASIAYWGLGQMMKGAGMAAAFVVTIGLVLGVMAYLGTWLPAESRDTPDPNTWDTEDRGEP
ncbi:MAG: RC-LH1 core complex protein PufX [Rhodobacteraceae bacterium]|nr:RC-LH1 core complex protein PufX [Paracoccaceae bacterium]